MRDYHQQPDRNGQCNGRRTCTAEFTLNSVSAFGMVVNRARNPARDSI